MATKSRGYVDSYHQSRINHVNGSAYPAPITTPFIGLYLGALPLSDGSGATDLVRVAVTWTAQAQDPNTNRWYIQPTAALSFAIPAATRGIAVGWGVYGAASGGTPVYFDEVPAPFPVNGGTAGVTITLPAASFRVWAEGAL